MGVSLPDSAQAKKKASEAIKCDQKFAEVKKVCEAGVNTVGKMRHVMKSWRKAAGYADFKCKECHKDQHGDELRPEGEWKSKWETFKKHAGDKSVQDEIAKQKK